jgi:hypothetical protein
VVSILVVEVDEVVEVVLVVDVDDVVVVTVVDEQVTEVGFAKNVEVHAGIGGSEGESRRLTQPETQHAVVFFI